MTAVAYLQRAAGWGPNIKVTVAATPEADAAAAAFFKRATVYTVGAEYAVKSIDQELTTDLGPAMSEVFFPLCEHKMSLALCMGPDHYPSAQQERELWG